MTTLLRISHSKEEFKRHLRRLYSPQLTLPFVEP